MATRTLAPSQTLGFGKYKDKTAPWVWENDPDYLRFLHRNGLTIKVSSAPAAASYPAHSHNDYNDDEGEDIIYPGDDDPNGDEEMYWTSVIGFR